jgi:hypothetical protein
VLLNITFAAAPPFVNSSVTLDGKLMGGEESGGMWISIEFWKITPPRTTPRDVARLRTNPKVAVAVAVSSWETSAWRAIKGAWKSRPAPIPATIW